MTSLNLSTHPEVLRPYSARLKRRLNPITDYSVFKQNLSIMNAGLNKNDFIYYIHNNTLTTEQLGPATSKLFVYISTAFNIIMNIATRLTFECVDGFRE